MTKHSDTTNSLIYELVDMAILPAALLICAKAVGMALLNTILGLEWNVQTIANAIFSVKAVYSNTTDALLVSSYTNLFMFICVIAGCMLITSKSMLFHHRKASPHFVLKLAKYDLLHLLKNSMHIYKEAFIWSMFLILTTIYICISFLLNQTYAWVAGLSFMFCLTFIWILVQDIEEDILFHSYK
jgi:hypothetical protein